MKIETIARRPAAWALAAALGLGGLALAAADHMGALNPPATFKYASADEPATHAGFAPVVKRVAPAVVSITATKVIKTSDQMNPQMDPFFRQFFGNDSPFGGRQMTPRSQRERGAGSGVIVSPNGYIITNNHVVDGASDVRVVLTDKREFKARVVGTDAKTDIAVLKVDADNLPTVVIGDSSKLEVGDYVLAIGNPFQLGGTVTMGIVSALGRSGLGIEAYEDFIQTDAPINPGNSGGALVNDRGELVGINTAILANGSEGNQGIGFAVPVAVAHNVMEQILHNGKVVRAYLGVMSEQVTPSLAKAFHADTVSGALVSSVAPDSPASHAGIQKGDIILAVNGKPVTDSAQLAIHISLMQPGTDVTVKVLRDGAERTVNAHLAELPAETAKADRPDHSDDNAMDGVSVENMTARTARQLGLPETASGVVVTQIDPSSAAADSGLQRGDVIQEVNRKPVHNVDEFQNALRNSKDQTLLLVNRQGNSLYLAV
jgi:serine protease Do